MSEKLLPFEDPEHAFKNLDREDVSVETWHSPHGTTWQAETYEEALEAERDFLAAQVEALTSQLEDYRRALHRIAHSGGGTFETVDGLRMIALGALDFIQTNGG